MFRLSALLLAAAAADETCLDDATSLIQEATKPVKTHRRNTKPLTGLLESARGFLTNGVTPDVVTFTQATLDELSVTIIPTLENESLADAVWMHSEWLRFQGAIDELKSLNLAIHQWNIEEKAASTLHKDCRDLEHNACTEKRQCEIQLYSDWLDWVREETQLREIHTHIEDHFCEQDEHGNFIANGTLHSFRVLSVPWMSSYTEQKGKCETEEEEYDAQLLVCNTKHGLLNSRSDTCNTNQIELEGKACAHSSAIAQNLRLFHTAWASLHASYQGITDLVYNQTQDRHQEYKTLVIIQCLLERVHQLNGHPCDESNGTVDAEMTTCQQEGEELVICTDRPALCPTYDPPPDTPPACADRDSVVGECLPGLVDMPCEAGWITAEMDPLPLLPQPGFTESNPGCNEYPDCAVCSDQEDLDLPGLTNYQTWLAAPASFAHSHQTFSDAANNYAARNTLWGATVDGCSSDNINSRDFMGDQTGQAIPLVVQGADETAAVRCCSHDGSTCESQVGGICHDVVTFHDANAICSAAGKRLCSQAEMGSGVCCGEGCWFNHFAVWISDGTPGNSAAPQYEKLAYGQDNCAEGKRIDTYDECVVAHEALGLEINPVWHGTNNNIPGLCSTREDDWGGGHHFHFNTIAEGVVRVDLAPVCRA